MSTAHVPTPGPVLVGVDAGATKSVAIAANADGTRMGRAEADGANPKRHGLQVAADRIAAVAVAALPPGTQAPDLLFVAGAGIDRPEHARALVGSLEARLPGTRILVVNDTLAVLRTATDDGVGLVVPASTGGNVIGRAADGRVTDRGHGIFGGGYVLGALAARAARRSATVGTELAAAIAAADLEWRGRRPSPDAARLGAAVVAAAEAGDPYPARMVRRWCGRVEEEVRREAARLRLGADPVVIVYGGLLEASPWLGVELQAATLRGSPQARIRTLEREPAEGAVLLAIDAWHDRPIGWDFEPRR